MRTKILGLVAAGLLAGPAPGQAAMITVYFKRRSTIVSDSAELFATNGIAVGSVIDGFYVYDDTATNTDISEGADDWDFVAFSINLPGAIIPSIPALRVTNFPRPMSAASV